MSTEITTKNKISEDLILFLCRQFLVEPEDIELDKSLVDTGVIDSMGLIEIASWIEKNYGIKVTEEKMNRDNFGSVLRIVDFIEREKV